MTMRFRISHFLSLALILITAGCATDRTDIKPLNESNLPMNLQTEEDEVRHTVVQFQNYLEKQEAFYRDEALEKYLDEVIAPFAQESGLDQKIPLRVKVLRDPTVNAMALMTGDICVHSGLLARLRSESELAFVLAHEISHIYHRDSVYQMQNLKRKTVTFKTLDLLFTPAAALFGGSGLSEMTLGLIYGSAVSGYGRQAESSADLFALEKIVKAGYDPRDAVGFFDVLLAEKKRYRRGIEVFFLSSHPSNERRKTACLRWIQENEKAVPSSGLTRQEKFLARTYGVRLKNVRFNLDAARYFHALENADLAIKQNPKDAEAYFLKAEIYQNMPDKLEKIKEEIASSRWQKIKSQEPKKLEAKWRLKSISFYQKAVELAPDFSPCYRGLGVSYFQQGDYGKAKEFFEKYLGLAPQAKDRRSVLRYLKDIEAIPAKGAQP